MAVAFLVVLWGGYIRGWQWTGFQANGQLWDWLNVLLVPVVLGTIPVWIQYRKYIGKDRRVFYAALIVAWAGFMIAGYLIPLTWTGFPGKKLSDWFSLLALPAAVVTAVTLFDMSARGVKTRLGPYQKAIIAALAAGWIVTIIGGYALHWRWTGYGDKNEKLPLITLWDWLSMFFPLLFPLILLAPLVKWVSGNAAGRASVARQAAAALTAAGGEAGVNESVNRQRLWSVPGDGVLARQGDLILLSAIDERGLAEKLLDSLARTSQSRGDGRCLADAVEDLVQSDGTWGGGHQGQPGPAFIAIGPADGGLTVTVSGTAWAEIVTAHGTDRLAASQPATVLRCVMGGPVHTVHGGLDTGSGVGDRTDRFSRLERGTVRARGLSYHCGLPAASPLARHIAAAAGATPDPAAAAGATGPGPAPGAAGAWQRPCPVEPPPIQPDAAGLHAAGPETAGPETDGPVAVDPGTAGPVPVEPAAPQADPGHLAAEEIQVPGPRAAAVPAPSDAAAAARKATGPAEVPPLRPADTARNGMGIAAGAPVVLGVYCENGHFGDPEARSCAVCGVPGKRLGSIPQPGPQPPLGALVFADDSAWELSTDCVIGREPALDPSVASGEARPLCITDAQVSRIHARVHLEGWRVFLVDLGSANGTRIRPPGKRSDQALEPNVPVPLQSGTRVYVATQGFRYEYQPGH